MFNYLALQKDEKDIIIKLIGQKEIKKTPLLKNPALMSALREAFRITEPSRLQLSKLREHMRNNCENSEDEIVKFYNALIQKKMSETLGFHDELCKLIGDVAYSDLDDEKLKIVNSFREQYGKQDALKIVFDSYIKFLCAADEETIENAKREKEAEKTEKLEKEIVSLNNQLEKQKNDYNDLAQKFNELKQKNSSAIKTINTYKNLLKPERMALCYRDLLDSDFSGTTNEDLYEEFTKKEKESFQAKDHSKVKEYLAAKYAVIKAIDGGK